MTYTNTNTNTRPYSSTFDREYDYSRLPSDLQRLDELDNYTVADDEIDPRGYSVIGRDGDELGSIDGLLASPSEGKALFAIIDTGGWFQSKKFAVPLQMVEFDAEDEQAHLGYVQDDFRNAPQYEDGNRDLAAHYRYWSGLATAAPARAETPRTAARTDQTVRDTDAVNEVRIPVTEEQAEVRKERRRAGYVTVHKNVDVETKHISEPVRHTRVEVESREVRDGETYDPQAANTRQLKEGETLRIPVVEEELEVRKTPRVTKEVVVQAKSETEQVERDVQLRHESVEVDEEGDVEIARGSKGNTNTRR